MVHLFFAKNSEVFWNFEVVLFSLELCYLYKTVHVSIIFNCFGVLGY